MKTARVGRGRDWEGNAQLPCQWKSLRKTGPVIPVALPEPRQSGADREGETSGVSFLNKSYDEVHVFGGVAERTGNQFDRAGVRGRRTMCRSVTDLGAKVRRMGDGYYYLSTGVWPDCVDRVDLNQPWTTMG